MMKTKMMRFSSSSLSALLTLSPDGCNDKQLEQANLGLGGVHGQENTTRNRQQQRLDVKTSRQQCCISTHTHIPAHAHSSLRSGRGTAGRRTGPK